MKPRTSLLTALLLLTSCSGSLTQCSDTMPRMDPEARAKNFGGDTALTAAPKEPAKPGKAMFDRDRIEFPDVPPGTRQEATVQLRNDGDQPLTVAIQRPDSTAWDLSGSCFERRVLDRSGACTIVVRFQPPTAGAFSGTIRLEEQEATVALAGAGRLPPPPPTVATGPSQAELNRRALVNSVLAAPLAPASRPQALERRTYQTDWTDKGWQRETASLPTPTLDRVVLRHTPIQATLVESLNTELGCPATATISEDVYAYKRGAKPLIRKGSRVEGQCGRVGGDSQSRLAIIWDRIVAPPTDGRIINIAAPSLDPMGRAGLPAIAQNYFWERYGKALLLSLINVGATYEVARQSGNQNQTITSGPFGTSQSVTLSPAQQALQQGQQDLRTITTDILNESLDFKKRLELPAGTAFIIYPQKDIWFDDEIIVTADPAERAAAARVDLAPVSPLPARPRPSDQAGRVRDVQTNLEGANLDGNIPTRQRAAQPQNRATTIQPSFRTTTQPPAGAPSAPSSPFSGSLEAEAGTLPR